MNDEVSLTKKDYAMISIIIGVMALIMTLIFITKGYFEKYRKYSGAGEVFVTAKGEKMAAGIDDEGNVVIVRNHASNKKIITRGRHEKEEIKKEILRLIILNCLILSIIARILIYIIEKDKS
ncbi:hypothetical protein QUF80_04025 [Desulfococcaceae bacterium HSG8]|nr:hypothetical protein [Desulfococcaceae bacterium HSG8]